MSPRERYAPKEEPTQADAAQAAQAADAVVEVAEAAVEAAVTPAEERAAERVVVAAEKLADVSEDLAADTRESERSRLCPTCHTELERYKGDNPHKQGTSYCPGCGTRWAAGLRERA